MNTPLSSWTLKFKESLYEEKYQSYTQAHSSIFLKFLLIIAALTCLVVTLIYAANGKPAEKIVLLSFITIGISLFYIIVHMSRFESKRLVDFFICFLILGLFSLHIEYLLPNFMRENQASLQKGEHYLWLLINMGKSLENITIILYIAKIFWGHIVFLNVLINFLCIRKFLFEKELNNETRGIFIHVTMVTIIISFFASYLNEKKERVDFFGLNQAKEILTGFERIMDDILPNQILLLSPDGKNIIYANKSSKSLFKNLYLDKIYNELQKFTFSSMEDSCNKNLKLANVIKSTIDENLLNPEHLNVFNEYEGTYKQEKKFDCSEMKEKKFDVKIGSIIWKNEKVVMILLSETTAYLKFKKIKEINDHKDILLATVTHDLRSPLNSILGMLELAILECKEKVLKALISTAHKSSKLLLFLINDILDYGQIDKKQLKIISEELHIEQIIEEIVEIIKFQASKKNLEFNLEISDEIKNSKIIADRLRVQQILLNLLGNAIKFTNNGFVSLQIVPFQQKAKFIISDSGIGIDQKNLANLFSIYFKIDEVNRTINKSGVGLGLYVSQNLAILMDPEGIMVESEINKGTKFSFSLPMTRHEDSSESLLPLNNYEYETLDSPVSDVSSRLIQKKKFFFFNEDCKNESRTNACRGKFSNGKIEMIEVLNTETIPLNFEEKKPHILIVDDDVMNILVLSNYLKYYGYSFETASNGQNAMEKILKNKNYDCYFSLILMDCNMPIMDGFTASEKIKSLIEKMEIKNLLIIGITANQSDENYIKRCVEHGMDFCITKPISRNKLKEILDKFLKC